MAQMIYAYEVELRIDNKNTGEVKTVVRKEHAYSVMDAVMQASFAVSAEAGSADVKVVRVGPPADAIADAALMTGGLSAMVGKLLKREGMDK